MNIDTPYARQPGDPQAQDLQQNSLPPPVNAPPPGEAEGDTGLSSLRPRLQDALRGLDEPGEADAAHPFDQPGTRIIERLADTVIRLQDEFLEVLHAALKDMGFDPAEKLTLRLDDSARLMVGGEHPDSASVAVLMAARADLSAAFTEIAVQSALLRDLRSLQSTAIQANAANSYMALAASPGRSIYQLSLKGDMNHFYFA